MANQTKTIECGKCNGRGEIPAFREVAGGVCFACNGTGKKIVAADYLPMRKFGCAFNGEVLFYVNARTETDALKKAVAHWQRHRAIAPAMKAVANEGDISVVAA